MNIEANLSFDSERSINKSGYVLYLKIPKEFQDFADVIINEHNECNKDVNKAINYTLMIEKGK